VNALFALLALDLAPCHLERLSEEVLCGVHVVFEDRETETGPRIGIQVAVLPALRREAEPDPLFVLAGGPGQGARSYAPFVARAFRKVRRFRDIVLVDLRGTGDSGALSCSWPVDDPSRLSIEPGMARDCLRELDADPRHYAHREALADLDEVRKLLDYERVNLWGGSWGTRAALLYATLHPESVRTVVLDGAVPFELEFPLATAADSERALDRLIEACGADPDCDRAFPALGDDISALFKRFREEALAAYVAHPRTGAMERVTLSHASLVEFVRVALYSPHDSAMLPWILERASQGDLGPLMAQAARSASWSVDTMAIGTTFTVLCTEDVPRLEENAIDAAVKGTFLGRTHVDSWRRACAEWPKGRPLDVDETSVLPTPALVLSGDLDPVTPPRWGEVMARRFRKSVHVVVPGAAHNTSTTGCVPDLIAEFVERGTAGNLDLSCVASTTRPPFIVSFAGSVP
jgi:pimeloyl-ACP methyl ester carboxylesterase